MTEALGRLTLVLVAAVALAACGRPTTYSVGGDVVAVDVGLAHLTIRHDDIPGLMPAMTMRFAVRSPEVLTGVSAGTRVQFQLERDGERLTVTQIVRTGVAGEGRPGLHDHTPHHGGVVAMIGLQHVEAVATAEGRVRVYLTDAWRRPVALDGIAGTVAVPGRDGDRVTLPLGVRDGAFEATGAPVAPPEVRVHVRLVRDGGTLDAHFLLPLGAATTGAAFASAEGCVPPPARDGGGRRPRCVIGFDKPVVTAAATPDARTAIVAVLDQGITAWRLPEGTLVTGFAPPPPEPAAAGEKPHAHAPNVIAVSADGAQVAVGLGRNVLRYGVATGRLLRQLAAPGGLVRSLAWSPDGKRLLVSTYYDPAAHLLRAEDGRVLRRLSIEREGGGVAFSADGRRMAVGSEIGPIALFELDRRAPRIFAGSTQAVETVAFVGDRVAAATADGRVRVWDVESGQVVVEGEAPTPLRRLTVAPGGRFAAAGGSDHTIRLYELATGAAVETLTWHSAEVSALAWAGTTLVAADSAGKVALWDLEDRLVPRAAAPDASS